MALKTLQITQSGAAIQVSAQLPAGSPTKVKWIAFQNNAAAAMRVGDSNVSSTRGYSLAATGGTWNVPVPLNSTMGADLTQWYVFGTSTQVLDIVYDDMVF